MTTNPSDPIARMLQHTLSVADDTNVAPDYAVGRIASRTMEIGVWRMHLPEGVFHFSRQARIIFGLPDDLSVLPVDKFLRRFSKAGRAKAAELITAALETRAGFQVEAEVVDFQNHVRYLEYFGDVDLNPNGDIAGLVGTVRDMTALRRAERLATTRLLMLRALLKHLPVAVAMFDRNMRYVALSDYWVAGHELSSAEDVIGKSHYDLFDLPEAIKREHRQVLAGITLERPRAYIKDKDGNTIAQNAILAPWYERHGEVGGLLIILPRIDPANTISPEKAISDKPLKGEFDALLLEIASA